MSHLKARKEKNCLNCGTEVQGRYCSFCGQENIEPKESAWHLVNHFFQDITHFDGKFFSTLKYLFTRPGFLSQEYALGRRAAYLNPVRMYIFTSAFFFLLFFNFFTSSDVVGGTLDINGKTLEQIDKMDSARFAVFTSRLNLEDGKKATPMTRQEFKAYVDSNGIFGGGDVITIKYKTAAAYDSALKAGLNDNRFVRAFKYRVIHINEKYRGNVKQAMHDFSELILHSLPQMLFISLPLLALILQMLYVRRREFYYVSHGIFSIHLYIFIFLVLIFYFCLDLLGDHWAKQFVSIGKVLLVLGIYFYVYKSMRAFYRQRRGKTIAKFLLLNFCFLLTLSFLFVFYILFSLFKL